MVKRYVPRSILKDFKIKKVQNHNKKKTFTKWCKVSYNNAKYDIIIFLIRISVHVGPSLNYQRMSSIQISGNWSTNEHDDDWGEQASRRSTNHGNRARNRSEAQSLRMQRPLLSYIKCIVWGNKNKSFRLFNHCWLNFRLIKKLQQNWAGYVLKNLTGERTFTCKFTFTNFIKHFDLKMGSIFSESFTEETEFKHTCTIKLRNWMTNKKIKTT